MQLLQAYRESLLFPGEPEQSLPVHAQQALPFLLHQAMQLLEVLYFLFKE
jgi:hypothetical protein